MLRYQFLHSTNAGYCQLLTPEWEKLAGAVKGNVKIAYWDTEQQGATPPLLGQIKGTPTIRLYKPKKKQGPSNKRKDVVDYNYERNAKDMKRFVDEQMPNFIERVNGSKGLQTFEEKAERNGLPRVLIFTSKASTVPLTKYLSTEFRRRLLMGEVYPSKPNKEIMDKYGVTDLPALIVFPTEAEEGAEPVVYDGDGFTKNKLQSFLSKYALKDPVFPKKKTDGDDEQKQKQEKEDEKKKKKQKEEL